MNRTTRAMVAMLCVGLAIFSGLYTTQAILPTLVEVMGMSTTQAALTVSAATGALAVCVVPASILSERFGRGRLLIISVLTAGVIGLLVPAAQTPLQLIIARGIQGAAMAGAPAVAMAWLAEELADATLARAMGLYIAGTSIGGLTGRLIPTGVLEFASWRMALLTSAGVSLALAVTAVVLLPAQRHFHPKPLRLRGETQAMLAHLRNPVLVQLYLVAFVAMGAFVSLYNFISFRLLNDFGLPSALAGAIFVLYLSGTWSAAQAGRLVRRFGRGRALCYASGLFILGAALTTGPLPAVVIGMLGFTAGFFAAHSIASGWVGQAARTDRAEASSMYVFCYYLGSSVIGAAAGALFSQVSWGGFVGVITALGVCLLGLAVSLSRKEI